MGRAQHVHEARLFHARIVTLAIIAGCGLVLEACSTSPPLTEAPALASESEASRWKGTEAGGHSRRDIAEGRAIAQRECATCHAIDQGVSPLSGAPPFRDVLFLNDSNWIAYRLIDAVRMGHDPMPLFDFDTRSANALIAYIESIGSTDGEHR